MKAALSDLRWHASRIEMADSNVACALCRRTEADQELGRVQVWENSLWRLTTAGEGELLGFSYLEPKRHIPYVTDLDGEEARTFGEVLGLTTRALKSATRADLVYIYVFGGGIPHLHVHLAPHHEGDPLNSSMIRGEVVETKLPSGATAIVSRDFPQLPASQHEEVLARLRQELAGED